MGRPKGELTIRGQSILTYLLDALGWPGPTLLVTAPGREHPPGWERFNREVIDPEAGGGPLRGVLTALEAIETSIVAMLTVDMPGVRLPALLWMIDALQARHETTGLMMRRQMNGAPQIEPFPCVLRATALPTVASRLGRGRRSVYGLLEEPGFEAIDPPASLDPRTWVNLNEPADVDAYSG